MIDRLPEDTQTLYAETFALLLAQERERGWSRTCLDHAGKRSQHRSGIHSSLQRSRSADQVSVPGDARCSTRHRGREHQGDVSHGAVTRAVRAPQASRQSASFRHSTNEERQGSTPSRVVARSARRRSAGRPRRRHPSVPDIGSRSDRESTSRTTRRDSTSTGSRGRCGNRRTWFR